MTDLNLFLFFHGHKILDKIKEKILKNLRKLNVTKGDLNSNNFTVVMIGWSGSRVQLHYVNEYDMFLVIPRDIKSD